MKGKFQEWADQHKYLFVQLPDWQKFRSKRKGSLQSEEYKTIRRKVNKYMRRCVGRVYGLHKMLVIQPGTTGATVVGVHLNEKGQVDYNKKIFKCPS